MGRLPNARQPLIEVVAPGNLGLGRTHDLPQQLQVREDDFGLVFVAGRDREALGEDADAGHYR